MYTELDAVAVVHGYVAVGHHNELAPAAPLQMAGHAGNNHQEVKGDELSCAAGGAGSA